MGPAPASAARSSAARLEDLLLDQFAVALAGSGRPAARAVQKWADVSGGSGRSLLIGTPRTADAEAAAFANGAAGHSFELDDTHDASLSHPGAVVIPAALAVGAEARASGADFCAAVVCGYEAMGRIGEAADAAAIIARGFHPTSIFGVFGAAAASARLMGLGVEGLLTAWGHALSLAGGSMQFSQESDGAEVKRLHAGFAARNGILAARLSAHGVSAPAESLEGKYGLFAMLGGDADAAGLTGRPERPVLAEVSIKPYACNRLFHAAIDALGELTGFQLQREAVLEIVILGPRKLAEQHMVRRPGTPMAAQYSLPFAIGATMAYGPERFTAYDCPKDAEVLAWSDLTSVAVDEALEADFPARFGAEAVIKLRDGRVLRKRVHDSMGTPAQPLSRKALAAKASALIGAHADFDYDRLFAAIGDLRQAPSLDTLQVGLRGQE